MKKIILVVMSLLVMQIGQSQNVNIRVNNQGGNYGGGYSINGISADKDIGGVDSEIIYRKHTTYVRFRNYNSFRVTIVYKIGNTRPKRFESPRFNHYYTADGTTGTKVIEANGCVDVKLDRLYDERKKKYYNSSSYYSVKGLIVRKVQ